MRLHERSWSASTDHCTAPMKTRSARRNNPSEALSVQTPSNDTEPGGRRYGVRHRGTGVQHRLPRPGPEQERDRGPGHLCPLSGAAHQRRQQAGAEHQQHRGRGVSDARTGCCRWVRTPPCVSALTGAAACDWCGWGRSERQVPVWARRVAQVPVWARRVAQAPVWARRVAQVPFGAE